MRFATGHFRLLAVICLALAAAGCTGSNLLPTGNAALAVTFEVVGEDGTTIDYDCVNYLLSDLRVRPLDGICAATATNTGEPCLDQTDCVGGPCEGSAADTLISGGGIAVVAANLDNPTSPGNLLGSPCALSKRCNQSGPICADVSECDPGQICALPYGNASEAEVFRAPVPLTLSEGLYEVSNFEFQLAMFSDNPSFLGCEGPSSYLSAYGDTLRFRMPEDGTKNLVFRLDLEALETAFGTGCSGLAPVVPDVVECLTCDGAP